MTQFRDESAFSFENMKAWALSTIIKTLVYEDDIRAELLQIVKMYGEKEHAVITWLHQAYIFIFVNYILLNRYRLNAKVK